MKKRFLGIGVAGLFWAIGLGVLAMLFSVAAGDRWVTTWNLGVGMALVGLLGGVLFAIVMGWLEYIPSLRDFTVGKGLVAGMVGGLAFMLALAMPWLPGGPVVLICLVGAFFGFWTTVISGARRKAEAID